MSTPYTTAYKLSRYRPAFVPPYMTGEADQTAQTNAVSETAMPFQPEHIAACAALFVDVFSNHHRPWTRPAARAFLTRLLNEEGNQGFVLLDALCRPFAFAIGSCRVSPTDHLKHFDLREFCVRCEMHGRGCGSRLLAHIERELQTTHVAFNTTHSSSRVAKMAQML